MKTFLFAMAFALSLVSTAQTIKGFVIDDRNRPVIGAQVMEVDSRNGTTTNIDGSFLMELNDSSSKVAFSFQGYESDTLFLTSDKLNQVVLKEKEEEEATANLSSYLMDYRVWGIIIWSLICIWLVLRTFRGIPSA